MELSASRVQNTSVLIRPATRWVGINYRDLWDYRELLYFLTWRDIKVRYKQTVLGVAWVILQPLCLMILFTAFFGRMVEVPAAGIPYSVFTYAALLPWQLFSRALNDGSMSLMGQEKMITKVYFPRILVPASAVLSALLDFAITLLFCIGFVIVRGVKPSLAIVALPVFVALTVMIAFGVSLWLAALNVLYRDVRYVLPFLAQLWLFATPIIYPISVIPDRWQVLYSLNPMVGVVEGFRWCLFSTSNSVGSYVAVSFIVMALVCSTGILYFQHVQQTFADVI
jgi:lipopolysaccharide transport system permease protein